MEGTQEWLNEELISSVLKASYENDADETPDETNTTKDRDYNFEVIDYKAKKAVEDGKNFTSKIYKVVVTYKDNRGEIKSKSFIMKWLNSALTGPDNGLCVREEQTLKALLRIENYIHCTLGPKVCLVKGNIVVLEDLVEQGFQDTKVQPLDYDHCVLALKALAKFHAGSLILHKNEPVLVQYIGFDFYTLKSDKFDVLLLFENSVRNFGEKISAWPECQQYAEQFSFIATKVREYYENLHKRNSLKVLNHGDYHLLNMMFKYDDTKVCDFRMIDFQTTRFVPQTCDFQFFVGSNADFDVKLNRLDELITVYLDTFNNVTADLGLPQNVTRRQFEEDLKADNIMYVIGVTFTFLHFIADNGSINSDYGSTEGNLTEEACKKSSEVKITEDSKKFIIQLLNDMNKIGLFESFRK